MSDDYLPLPKLQAMAACEFQVAVPAERADQAKRPGDLFEVIWPALLGRIVDELPDYPWGNARCPLDFDISRVHRSTFPHPHTGTPTEVLAMVLHYEPVADRYVIDGQDSTPIAPVRTPNLILAKYEPTGWSAPVPDQPIVDHAHLRGYDTAKHAWVYATDTFIEQEN